MEESRLPQIYEVDGLSIELYDVMHPPGSMADTAMLLELARESGGPVLELASGTGRVLFPLAEAGYEITGLEKSPGMLRRAGEKLAALPADVRSRVRLVPGDMREFDLAGEFGLIYCTFRSFLGLLEVAEQKSCLRSVRRHLRSGGRFMLDLFDPQVDRLVPRGPYFQKNLGVFCHPVSGRRVLWEAVDHENDPVKQHLAEIWRYTEVDDAGRVVRQELEEIRLRWTYRYELHHLLELCGFRLLAEYSDFRRSAPAYGRELVVIAEGA